MQYKIYCLLKSPVPEENERVVRVKVFADCIADALIKAKERFKQKLKEKSFNIFMYETVRDSN